MLVQNVDEEIKAHTEEELAVLLAIGPKGCSWEKLRCKVQIVASVLKSLGWEFVDLSDETVWEILCSAKNRTLWIKKRKYCITTESGAKVYHCLLERISKKNAEASRFIDRLHGMSISDPHLLAGWFARAKSIEFLNVDVSIEDLVLVVDGREIQFSKKGDANAQRAR